MVDKQTEADTFLSPHLPHSTVKMPRLVVTVCGILAVVIFFQVRHAAVTVPDTQPNSPAGTVSPQFTKWPNTTIYYKVGNLCKLIIGLSSFIVHEFYMIDYQSYYVIPIFDDA